MTDRGPRVSLTSRYAMTTAGGIEACVAELVPRLRAMRPHWQIKAICAFETASAVSRIPFLGDVAAALIIAWKTRGDDVTIVSGAEYAFPRALVRRWRERTIVVWHGTRAGEIPSLSPRIGLALRVYAALERGMQRSAFAIRRHVAVGDSVRRELVAAYGRAPALRVAVNGAGRVPGSVTSTASGPRLLWIGTNAYKKGLDRAIAACRTARETLPDLTLTVVGLPAGSVPAEQWVRAAGVVPRREMEAIYDAAAVVLATTRYEACSIAMIEAMARGKAIVASSAVAWMLGEAAGFDEPASIAAETVRACTARGREELETRSRAAVERFDWQRSVTTYVEEIESLLAEKC